MRPSSFCILVAILISPISYAQEKLSLNQWLDLFVDSCVGAGSSSITSGTVDANGQIALKKLTASGSLAGQLVITKSNYKLLSDGISNKMSAVAAEQADKVRVCLDPVKKILLQAMQRQLDEKNPHPSKPIYILSPDEEKVMKFLAKTKGNAGTGRQVPFNRVAEGTGMSDLRLRATLKMLEAKILAVELVGVVSFFDDGDMYVLKMGYAD
ncbi:MAG: hypothetical protein HZC23_11205 [Rhodocyclales bacterium]|nr:hypothetical protein [Rhodocyclales bacterium]